MDHVRSSNASPASRVIASRGFWLVVLAIVVISLPSLAVGWVDDDVMQRAMLGNQLVLDAQVASDDAGGGVTSR